jgi:mannonate dehydratase
MDWHVVESLPVHENIKAGTGDLERLYDNYRRSIHNLGKQGINVITYNFMPVFDWFRTDVTYRLPDNAQTLRFDPLEMVVFDVFLLKRKSASADYSDQQLTEAEELFKGMSEEEKHRLSRSALMALPGSEKALTPEYVFGMMSRFEGVGPDALRTNLIDFLRAVVPAAVESGVFLAIHPDDPPFPILGLPRIVSTASDFEAFLTAVPEVENGLCFCTGSLGARKDNNVIEMYERWSDRVHFLHLRNTSHSDDGSFIEAPHLAGDTDMYVLMKDIVSAMQRQGRSIPMRPDHGYKMAHEMQVDCYPGYSYAGRAKGLAELRGLELAIQRSTD